MVLMFTASLVFAQVDSKLTKKINLKGKKIFVSTLMMTMAEQYGVNFVIPKKLDNVITISLKNVSINAAIKAISKSLNLKVKKIESIYYFSKPHGFDPMKMMHMKKMGKIQGKRGRKFQHRKGKHEHGQGCHVVKAYHVKGHYVGNERCSHEGVKCSCGGKAHGCKGNCDNCAKCRCNGEVSGCRDKKSTHFSKRKDYYSKKTEKFGHLKKNRKRIKKIVLRTMDDNKNYRDQQLIYTSTPMTEYVSIDVKAFDVKKLFTMIEKMSGHKIYVNPRISGYVDYKVKGKYFKDAVKEIADLANARVIETETSLTVIK